MDFCEYYKHVCSLKFKQDIVANNTPPGTLYNFRIWLRKYTMSSDKDLQVRSYLKSNYRVRCDRKMQFTTYFWSIHPLSDAKSVLEKLTIIFFFAHLLIVPSAICYGDENVYLVCLDVFINLYFILDITLCFFTGYVDLKNREVILDKQLIVKRYLLSWFVFDAISSLPYSLITLGNVKRNWVNCLSCFKWFKILQIMQYLKMQKLRHAYSNVVMTFISLAILYFFFIYLTAMYLLLFESKINQSDERMQDLYLRCLYRITNYLTSTGYGVIEGSHQNTFGLKEHHIIFLTVGFLFSIIEINFFLQIMAQSGLTRINYQTVTKLINSYCNRHKVPDINKKRVLSFFKFKYSGQYVNEDKIDQVLTPFLKSEILIVTVRHLLESIDLFNFLPMQILNRITLCTKCHYYLKNDVIIGTHQFSDFMYIIRNGTVALYDGNGFEVCHIEDGDYIGELGLIFNIDFNMATAVAISACEVISISKEDFHRVLKDYPYEFDLLHGYATQKVENAMNIMQVKGYDFVPPHILIKQFYQNN